MRRAWLALGVGAVAAGAIAVMMFVTYTRVHPNGGTETMSYDMYHPWAMNLSLPGVVFFWISALLTDIDWNLHQLLARILVTVGDAMFYSAAAYAVLRLSARLSLRWRQE